jgi:hypothetical protein
MTRLSGGDLPEPDPQHRRRRRAGAIGRCLALAATLVALVAGAAGTAGAQNGNGRPNVFFDCSGPRCDSRYYRTEITWVNWVNDKEDASVHLIMTSQTTGAGGREYLLHFIGTGETASYDDRHGYRALPTNTDRETLDGIVHTMGLGLAMFADEAGYRGIVVISGTDKEEAAVARGVVARDEVNDPWNLWVFRLDGEVGIDGETTQRRTSLEGGFSASRVTPDWRVRVWGDVRNDHFSIDLSDGTFKDTRTGWSMDTRIVYALLDHWSVGLDTNTSRNLTYNQNFRIEVAPALEYSIFPYEEATRRSFTFYYTIGPAYRDYAERTIYGETEETRWEQSMDVRFSQRQPWGNASVNVSGSHFLHDFNQRLLRLGGDLEFRIFRGLSLEVSGNVSSVNDQIYLAAEEATDEEALLRLQARATEFDYGVEVGFEFRFGSIFNNVVNNRFRRRRF